MISVVIATFNGSKFILIQLNSILCQLNQIDELVIVDDCSNDDTLDIIKNIGDSRIKIYSNEQNVGHVKSFEKGISLAKGEIIFLSDQDDFWLPNKIDVMSKFMVNNNFDMIISAYYLTKVQGFISGSIMNIEQSKKIFNLISIITGRNNYFGSLMCFKSGFVSKLVPFPSGIEAHDLYIAIKINLTGKVGHLNMPLVIRTITGYNLTNRDRSLIKKIKSRIYLIKLILKNYL
jgi:glycosyltransferase involved in cell wall biosynthesis